jgi:hypothetical protein
MIYMTNACQCGDDHAKPEKDFVITASSMQDIDIACANCGACLLEYGGTGDWPQYSDFREAFESHECGKENVIEGEVLNDVRPITSS